MSIVSQNLSSGAGVSMGSQAQTVMNPEREFALTLSEAMREIEKCHYRRILPRVGRLFNRAYKRCLKKLQWFYNPWLIEFWSPNQNAWLSFPEYLTIQEACVKIKLMQKVSNLHYTDTANYKSEFRLRRRFSNKIVPAGIL